MTNTFDSKQFGYALLVFLAVVLLASRWLSQLVRHIAHKFQKPQADWLDDISSPRPEGVSKADEDLLSVVARDRKETPESPDMDSQDQQELRYYAWVMNARIGDACLIPPVDYFCTRGRRHDGPCAAHPVPSTARDPYISFAELVRGKYELKAGNERRYVFGQPCPSLETGVAAFDTLPPAPNSAPLPTTPGKSALALDVKAVHQDLFGDAWRELYQKFVCQYLVTNWDMSPKAQEAGHVSNPPEERGHSKPPALGAPYDLSPNAEIVIGKLNAPCPATGQPHGYSFNGRCPRCFQVLKDTVAGEEIIRRKADSVKQLLTAPLKITVTPAPEPSDGVYRRYIDDPNTKLDWTQMEHLWFDLTKDGVYYVEEHANEALRGTPLYADPKPEASAYGLGGHHDLWGAQPPKAGDPSIGVQVTRPPQKEYPPFQVACPRCNKLVGQPCGRWADAPTACETRCKIAEHQFGVYRYDTTDQLYRFAPKPQPEGLAGLLQEDVRERNKVQSAIQNDMYSALVEQIPEEVEACVNALFEDWRRGVEERLRRLEMAATRSEQKLCQHPKGFVNGICTTCLLRRDSLK